MELITSGICVAYQETQDSHTEESLNRVINHALEHERIVGGWKNEENGRYYFDSVRVFNKEEMAQALEFARANEQIAIYDLEEQEEITVK